jgi:hypothetical protein
MMRVLVPVVSLGVGAAVVAVPGGCHRSAADAAAGVRGAVTFQGKPLAGGLVVFAPDPDRGGRGKPAKAEVGADGRFELPDVPPGWYRVAIAPPHVYPAAISPPFPAKLARPDLSGLVREVRPGRDNVFEFAVTVPPG